MRWLLVPITLALAACGQSLSPSAHLDPDVAPVTSGSWYKPAVATLWQIQLSGTINTGYAVDVYDVDLFDTPAAVFTTLHGASKKILCYFSAGSAEDWRDDYSDFLSTSLGKDLEGWPGEKWVDVRSQNVLDVTLARLDKAVSRGCDGVDPDNVNGYTNDTGFSLTATDQ
ncbi:MAG TPA: endo alpha-1,4 polygalactosaminidase, partial [Bdellovibrionota bacterium]|nr:endo alpha-1,4 polygalactosaminidase [Bdellovibrionota bacterium]